MSSSEGDCEILDQDLPSATECEERCRRFAEVTGTDSALAMFFLQDRQWNLDQALNSFFEQNGGGVNNALPAAATTSTPSVALAVSPSDTSSTTKKNVAEPGDPEPHRIRVLSWNIDGLDGAHLKQRTKAVIDTIKKEKAEVVFLQEVVGVSEAALRASLDEYRMVCGGTTAKEGYYTAILLHKTRAMMDDFHLVPFPSSMMARNLLEVNCCVKGVPMTLMTSHLESTKSHAGERKKQLQMSLKRMTDSPSDRTVVFGGDLNVRDKEMEEVGGLPKGITDMWEATGSRKDARYTWDTFRNDNLGGDHKWRTKLRFDRLFLRQRASTPAVKPVYFELVGLERIVNILCFPSDHWGILTHFDILPSFDQ